MKCPGPDVGAKCLPLANAPLPNSGDSAPTPSARRQVLDTGLPAPGTKTPPCSDRSPLSVQARPPLCHPASCRRCARDRRPPLSGSVGQWPGAVRIGPRQGPPASSTPKPRPRAAVALLDPPASARAVRRIAAGADRVCVLARAAGAPGTEVRALSGSVGQWPGAVRIGPRQGAPAPSAQCPGRLLPPRCLIHRPQPVRSAASPRGGSSLHPRSGRRCARHRGARPSGSAGQWPGAVRISPRQGGRHHPLSAPAACCRRAA